MEFEKAFILDIVYGYEPMTRSLAGAIKVLRCDQGLPFERIPNGLNPGFGDDLALGNELSNQAKAFLGMSDPKWD